MKDCNGTTIKEGDYVTTSVHSYGKAMTGKISSIKPIVRVTGSALELASIVTRDGECGYYMHTGKELRKLRIEELI